MNEALGSIPSTTNKNKKRQSRIEGIEWALETLGESFESCNRFLLGCRGKRGKREEWERNEGWGERDTNMGLLRV
jgi:hypothetical protein